MLGTLSKWLRFFGFDTFLAIQQMTDEELFEYAQDESRVILTRDKELIFRAQKRLIPIIYIKSEKLDDQLDQTIRETKIKINNNILLSRCAKCNTILQKIDKNHIQQIVPLRVFQQHERFFCCPSCKRIYWMGTHTQQITKKLIQFQERYQK